MWGWDHDDMRAGSAADAWLVVLVVLVLVLQIALLVLQVAGPRRGAPAATGGDTARRVLDERLARGEITPEEYREARSLLGP